MIRPVQPAGPGATAGGLVRSTVVITVWNAVSRASGFLRVLAVGAALGATFLANTYQSANLVSNVLFDLLAAGLLSAPLVPAFVARLDAGDQPGAERLAGTLLSIALAGLATVTAAVVVAAPQVMRLLTVGISDRTIRAQEIRLGSFLLRFFAPQVLLYAIGAVASALLHARRRFGAVAAAPVANNLVVSVTMLVAIALGINGHGLRPTRTMELVLAVGTTAGVAAMTAVPLVGLHRAGIRLRPTRFERSADLRAVLVVGGWGAVFLAANQVLLAATLVLANPVAGGVLAYQIAFTFFLLPHALLAQPLFTALYPRLAADVHAARWERFARDTAEGVRVTALLTMPAAAALVAGGRPVLRLVHLGALDAGGADFVAAVLAAYASGVTGYAVLLLLVRAATAAGQARLAGLVGIGVAGAGSLLMTVSSLGASGRGRVVVLGLAYAVSVTAGAVVLFLILRRHTPAPWPPVAGAVGRMGGVAVAAAGLGALAGRAVPGGGRLAALVSLAAAGATVAAVVVVGARAVRLPRWRSLAEALRG